MQKVDTVLLIDDDEVDNLAHARVIKKAGFAENILVEQSPVKALDLLKSTLKDNLKFPDVIFLDLNMPMMNGFEFLEAYSKLPEESIKKTKIFILSSSLNPEDEERAFLNPYVHKFIIKPLPKELLASDLS